MNGSSLVPATLSISILLGAGCFNPDLPDGGFLCQKNGACPEGFACRDEGTRKVCRKSVSVVVDQGAPDGPAPDLESSPDGASDAQSDGPASDGPNADGPNADGPGVDGPRPTDGGPDQPTPDLPPPDLPIPDGPQPVKCNLTDLLIINELFTSSDAGKFELVLAKNGDPHFVYLESTSPRDVMHTWLKFKGTTVASPEPVAGAKAMSVAATVDNKDNLVVLYVKDTTKKALVSVRSLQSSSAPWSTPKVGWGASTQSLDLAGGGGKVFAAVTGETSPGAIVANRLWISAPAGGGAPTTGACGPQLASATYSMARAATNGTSIVMSLHEDTGAAAAFWVHSVTNNPLCQTPKSAMLQGQISGKDPAPSPVAITIDGSGVSHMAFVADTGTGEGDVLYTTWDGTSKPGTPVKIYLGGKAKPRSVDIALDGNNKPVISYVAGANVNLAKPGGSGWTNVPVSNKAGTETRVMVDLAGNVLLAYDHPLSSPHSELHYTCKP